MQELTSIGWIGHIKRTGDEWVVLSRKFYLDQVPAQAVLRADSYGVSGISVNGEFVEGTCGRYPGRILCVECTSGLRSGENEITIRLGGHYYQGLSQKTWERRQSWFSAVAAELRIPGQDAPLLVTDESWTCTADDGVSQAQRFSDVTQADYDRFWKAAAMFKELGAPQIPQAVLDTVGQDYFSYACRSRTAFAEPVRVLQDAMSEEMPFMIWDFGRIQVGYVELEYDAPQNGTVRLEVDYTEDPREFREESRGPWGVVQTLAVEEQAFKGTNFLRFTHRRGGRYVKIRFSQGMQGVRILGIRFRLSMLPAEHTGWFQCPEPVLNEAWEMGKYTLRVNKHQEYESCPRNEMKFFSGDGIIEALIDYYAFGDDALVDASLAIKELASNSGLRGDIYDRNTSLWDYPAWRIVMIYNQYRYYGDLDLVRRYYEEMVLNTRWMIQKMNRYGLIYQYPVFSGAFYADTGTVEYTCSRDRLGEKPYLNALLYAVLRYMSEFAGLLEDPRGLQWAELAEKVKEAMNDRLWDEEAGAYRDTYDPSYVPQDGNALAVLFGVADGEKAARALDTLCRENWSDYGSAILSKEMPVDAQGNEHTRGGVKTISPAACMYEAEARFLSGDPESALELIRRCWGTMIRKGARTFWEFAPNNGTDRWIIPAHGWSGGCTYLLSAYVLGIRPGKPGYETLVFCPYEGFESFKGVVPTAKGLVAVKCETVSGKRKYVLCLPRDLELETVTETTLEIIRY